MKRDGREGERWRERVARKHVAAISEPKRESRWKERGKKVLRGALDDRRKRGEGRYIYSYTDKEERKEGNESEDKKKRQGRDPPAT